MSGILKDLSPLVHPIGFGWLMLVLAFVVCAFRRRALGAVVSLLAAGVLWLLAQPRITLQLLGSLERPWLAHTFSHATNAEAVIVLGGGWQASRTDFAGLDLTPASDRLMTGIGLCRSGKSGILVVGGDPTRPIPDMPPDSDRLRSWLRDWNLLPAEFLTLGPVLTTAEEARRARELVDRRGWKRVLLVTSALHMRRALATFEAAGVPVEPVACDFQVLRLDEKLAGWKAFPDEESLMIFSLWWHEQLGWIAYRVFGHV